MITPPAIRIDDLVKRYAPPPKSGEEGKLYGSVGTQDIADALAEQGIEVARSEVRLPEGAIRALGEYEIGVHLHSDVDAVVRVEVLSE